MNFAIRGLSQVALIVLRNLVLTLPKQDIPDVVNSYFSSVGRDLADKISATPNPLLSGNFKINKTNAKFHFRTIQVQEVRDAFTTVKTAKSFGVDNISSFFLKLALPSIENSLALLFNTSVETSAFPDLWKNARGYSCFKRWRQG